MQKFQDSIKFIFSFRPPPSSRYAWVDYAKGIAIIFVAYRHVIYGLLYQGVSITPALMDANELLYGFRMPLFFFLAGLFYASSVKKRGANNFIVSKVNTLLYPYLLWCIIQLTLQLVFSHYTNGKRVFGDYVDILIHPRNMLQLWYLFALFNVSALYLFADQVLKLKPWMHLILGIVLLAMKPLAGNISTLSDIMIYYVYFAIGHLSASFFFEDRVQKQLASIPKVVILLPVFLWIQYYCMMNHNMNIFLFSALAMVGGLLVIMISMVLSKYNILRFLQTLGHYSLFIYLLHVGIIFLLRTVILHFGWGNNVPAVTFSLVAAGIFLSIILYRTLLLLNFKYFFKGPFVEPGKKEEDHRKMPLKMHLL